MCGIVGTIGTNHIDRVELALQSIKHRGPDDQGVFSSITPCFAVGACRLSFNDLKNSKQPFASNDGQQVLCFNGELYNYKSLRKELIDQGYHFRSTGDTEVALHSLHCWGVDAFKKWNGMWALSYINLQTETFLLCRDPFGQKPLYYCNTEEQLTFGSELSAILELQPDTIREKDLIAIAQFLSFDYIPAPRTLYKGIQKLEAGTYLEAPLQHWGKLKKNHYFSPNSFTAESISLDSSPQRPFKDMLSRAIELCLTTDENLAFALSGGVDSSAILALATTHRNKLHSYTVGFEQNSFDESTKARDFSNSLGIISTFTSLRNSDFEQLAATVFSQLDEPLGDSSLIPSYVLAQEISKSFKGFLGGDGADELFAGYDPFLAAKIQTSLRKLPFHKEVLRFIHKKSKNSQENMNFKFRLGRFLQSSDQPISHWLPSWMSNISIDEINALLGTQFKIYEIYEPFLKVTQNLTHLSAVDQIYQQFLQVYLPNNILMVRDRSSMLNSVEARSPFLDMNIAKWALSKNISSHISSTGRRKSALKKELRNILPQNILNRSKKGFGSPIEFLLSEKPNWIFGQSFFSNPILSNMGDEHIQKKKNRKSVLWNSTVIDHMNIL